MKSRVAKRGPRWLTFLLVIFLVAAGAGLALFATKTFPNMSLFATNSESRNTQLIDSITREEQVVLLSLGIQGIKEESGSSKFFGLFSERSKFLQYNFDAKLGIEGKDVVIEQTAEDEYLVSIPKFIFIGHYNPTFKLAAEKNGVLSWVTPKVDSIEMVNEILDPAAQDEYIVRYEATLQDQAKAFYNSIITSIDPGIVVTFEFHQ